MAVKAKKKTKNGINGYDLSLKHEKLSKVDEKNQETLTNMTNISDKLAALAVMLEDEDPEDVPECPKVAACIEKARIVAKRHTGPKQATKIDE